jgi:hypothetical protein
MLAFDFDGIQNGAPDGLALVDEQGDLVQFLSYEGSFSAVAGPAAGELSQPIGVSQSSSTPAGAALQATGPGQGAADFVWIATSGNTRGSVNTGQEIDACLALPAVPAPGSGYGGALGLLLLLAYVAWPFLSNRGPEDFNAPGR